MIYFFVTRQHAYTMSWFLSDWASMQFKKNLRIVPYDLIPLLKNITPGTFIFSDLERLNNVQLKVVEDFSDQIISFNNKIPIINHPRFVLRRYKLLRKLYDVGINKFNVFHAAEIDSEPEYPVFLRIENDHSGPRTKLLKDRKERDMSLLHLAMQGFDINHLIQIELCETKSTDGYYRKYAAFRIGEKIIPAHIIFESEWLAKESETPKEKIDEENKYISENPHADKILEIFNIAGITFGRIDYGILNGVIQTWEINTNPILNQPRKEYLKRTIPGKEKLAKQLEEGLMSINYGDDDTKPSDTQQKISFTLDINELF